MGRSETSFRGHRLGGTFREWSTESHSTGSYRRDGLRCQSRGKGP